MAPVLSVIDAMEATKGFIRPMREGEEVLNAGLVVAVGRREKKDEVLHVQGLVLRTSGIASEHPYLVELWVDLKVDFGKRMVQEKSIECGCPAGQSAKCKHVVAVMLYLSRIDEEDLDDLSCTDVEQQWGTLKKATLSEYQAKRVGEMCHASAQKDTYVSTMREVTPEMEAKWIERLLRYQTSSEYFMCFSGIRRGQGFAIIPNHVSSGMLPEESSSSRNLISKLITFRSWSLLGYLRVATIAKLQTLDESLVNFYKNHVAINHRQSLEMLECAQGSPDWFQCRKLRLNASKARSQYTYFINPKADWDKRYKELYQSNFHGNSDTVRGLTCEKLAREAYESTEGAELILSGVIVREELPWVSASVDGTVINDKLEILRNIEIKTLKEGTRLNARELEDMGAISTFDSNKHMKKTNDHYGQIQIGMLLSGLEECDYLIYSVKGKDYVLRRISFDSEFLLEIFSRLIPVYFDELLPRMMVEFDSKHQD